MSDIKVDRKAWVRKWLDAAIDRLDDAWYEPVGDSERQKEFREKLTKIRNDIRELIAEYCKKKE